VCEGRKLRGNFVIKVEPSSCGVRYGIFTNLISLLSVPQGPSRFMISVH
jgi:hypothetical protein